MRRRVVGLDSSPTKVASMLLGIRDTSSGVGSSQRSTQPGHTRSSVFKHSLCSDISVGFQSGPKSVTACWNIASMSATTGRSRCDTIFIRAWKSVCGVYSSCGQRKACFLEISCRLGMAIWDGPLAMPPGVCCASPVQTTRHVGGSIATEATSRSPPYCCPSSITTMTSFCCHDSRVEKGLALSPAHDPPVISRRRRCCTLCLLEEWKISKYVPDPDYLFASESATKRPMKRRRSVGTSRYNNMLAKLRVPVFSLQMT